MSVNKLISLRVPIVDAMDEVGLDHDKEIPFFTRQAILAEKEIGSSYQFERKHAVLDINHCVACLPNEAAYIELAILGDLGCDCGDLLRRFCNGGINNTITNFGTNDNTFFVIDAATSSDGTYNSYVNHQIQNNKLIFEQDFDGKKVTIQYYAPQVDCDGFPMIVENHVQALKWYIIYRWYFKKKGINSFEYGKMNLAKDEWNRECAHARAQDGMLTHSDRSKIVGMYHNPYAGISLSTGMYTTLGNWYSIW